MLIYNAKKRKIKRSGRPRVGDAMLDKITVRKEIKKALRLKAIYYNVTIPEARRMAYEEFCSDAI